jgi:glycine betaine/proline transport system permease protein
MFNLFMNIPTLPLAHWIDSFVAWLTQFSGFFGVLTNFIGSIVNAFQAVFDLIPI